MIRIFFFLGYIILCTQLAYAGGIDSLFRKVLPTQEKVYLHFDNNWYVTGDTIWYKAYVVRADNNRVSPLSRILYVELLDQQGFLKERQKIIIDYNGQGNGQFHIPDSAFCGYYEIRAYTKWMMNFGYEKLYRVGGFTLKNNGRIVAPHSIYMEASPIHSFQTYTPYHEKDIENIFLDNNMEMDFMGDDRLQYSQNRIYHSLFSRILPVYQRPDSAKHFRRKNMPRKVTMGDYEVVWHDRDVNMKFYPEGGNLVEGHLCRVGWEALDKEGRRYNFKGALLEDGYTIDTLRPVHGGRGAFSFVPQEGRSYKVRMDCNGRQRTFRLPRVEKEGVCMYVSQTEDSVRFNIGKTLGGRREVYLSLLCRGKVVEILSLDFGDGDAKVSLPKSAFPVGVNQATVFSSEGRIYSDRLFFVRREEDMAQDVKITGMKGGGYRPKEKASLTLTLLDREGRPVAGQALSVAVRDGDQADYTFATGNIMTEMLLQSELKGFVENPDYYFEEDDAERERALDVLMLIQGWRRYRWEDAARAEAFTPQYQPEQTTMISGRGYSLRVFPWDKKDRRMEVFCSLRLMGERSDSVLLFQGRTTTDPQGYFSFSYAPFYGNARLVLRGNYADRKRKKRKRKTHDPNILLRKEYFFPAHARELSWYETNTPDIMPTGAVSRAEYEDGIYSSRLLPQVNIKSKRRPHTKRQKDKPVVTWDFLDFINDQWDMGYYERLDKATNQYMTLRSYLGLIMGSTTGCYELPFDENGLLSYDWKIGVEGIEKKTELSSHFPSLNKIEIVTDDPIRPTNYEFHHLDRRNDPMDGGGSYAISKYINITTFPVGKTRIISGREYNFPGFNQPAEFYNPDYSNAALPDIKDYRKTLYWNPNVTTDENGKALIEFYNNSVATEIQVSVEGITKDGRFIVHE